MLHTFPTKLAPIVHAAELRGALGWDHGPSRLRDIVVVAVVAGAAYREMKTSALETAAVRLEATAHES